MINYLYPDGESTSSVSAAVISISIILLSGFLMTRITKKLRLPNVTAYIVAGILIGPFCLNLIPQPIISGTEFLSDIAVAFIAFSTGHFFRLDVLKKNGGKVMLITLFEALTASILVFVTTFFILHLNLTFSIVLAVLASTTASASTMMIIRQTGAKGNFVETLLQVVALDNLVGLVAYSVAISIAVHSTTGEAFSFWRIAGPILTNILVMILGAVFGLLLSWLVRPKTRTTDNRLIISVALLFGFCGVCTVFDVSPLLGCMSLGMVYINITDDDKLFKQLEYFSPPLLLMFFVRSGMSFDLNALMNNNGSIGSSPLILISILYFLMRIIGKNLGAFTGCAIAKMNRDTRNCLGLDLVPQAGIAIGLAALSARTLGGETGRALETIILASSILYEFAGPASAKLSLYLSKSYSTKLEDLVDVNETAPDGKEKSQVELLIDRIQKIQEELPSHTINEAEEAFTEAAENQNSNFWMDEHNPIFRDGLKKRRRK
ncbi:MAG: cation:proton antiporter [Treponema sp.]|nr:cation:proton antiporter [Treponema sp.]